MIDSPLNANDADVVTLRPHGIGRYFESTFLAIWLVGWIIGECLALAALASIVLAVTGFFSDSRITQFGRSAASSGMAFVLVFLGIWLTGWTIGGIAAWRQLLRKTAGADRIRIVADGLELTRRAGPFWNVRQFDRSLLRRIRTRPHDKALVADTDAGTQVLSDLGTAAERESLCQSLRQRLNLTTVPLDPLQPPSGWRLVRDQSESIRLMRPSTGRRTTGVILWLLTVGSLYGWSHRSPDEGAQPGALILILILAFAAAWVMWAHEEWIVRHGRLEYRLQFGPWLKARTFEEGQFEVVRTTDSDGDSRYKLLIRDSVKKRTFDSALHDDAELVDCGRWLEAVTGFPVKRQL